MDDKKKQFTVMLTDVEHRRLKLAAKQDGRTISAQIVYMVNLRLAEIRREQGE